MNLKQVKAITIPEGSVKSITDSLGRVLWKKVSDIRTLWTGEAEITQTGSTGFPFSINNISVPSGDSLKLRLTFSKLINNPSDRPSKFISTDKVYVTQYPENEDVIVDIEVNSGFDKAVYTSYGSAVILYLKYTNNTLQFSIGYSSSVNAELKLIRVQQVLLDELVEGIGINRTTSTGSDSANLPTIMCQLYVKGAQDNILAIDESDIRRSSRNSVLGNIGRIGHGITSLILRSNRQTKYDTISNYKLWLNSTSIDPTTTTSSYFEWIIDLTGVSEITDYHVWGQGAGSSRDSNRIEVIIKTA